MKKGSVFYLVAIFTLLVVSAVVFFFINRVAVPDHVSSKIDLDTGKGRFSREVDWINGGGSLPHPDGGGGGSHSEPNPGHYQGGSGNNGDNDSGYSEPPKPDGTPYLGYSHVVCSHVVWTGDGHIRPADGYSWENPNDPSASNYRVVPLPLGTPEGHLNVVWVGDGQHVMPAEGYKWKNPNDPRASNYRVVPLTTKEKIQKILPGAVRALKDRRIRNWIVNNVKWKLSPRPSDRDLLSPWAGEGCLIFTERFLTETKATRENLFAFESGKLFFTIMKDKPVKDGKTMEAWFADFSEHHNSTIWNMRGAKSKDQNEDLSMIGDFADKESMFGYMFRAQALQLDKPTDKKARQKWDGAIREFQAHVNPLLRSR